MKIAAAIDKGLLCPVDKCARVKLYTMEKGALCAMEERELDTGALWDILAEQGASVLLCSEPRPEGEAASCRPGPAVFCGSGRADGFLLDLLERQLICDPEACPRGGACAGCEGGCL